MMKFEFYNSLIYWLAFIALVIFFRFFSKKSSVRQYLMLFVNMGLLLAIPRFNYIFLSILLVLSLLTYSISLVLNDGCPINNKSFRIAVSLFGFLIILGALIVFKYHWPSSLFVKRGFFWKFGNSEILSFIGISYFSFKMMHFIIESYKKSISINLLLFLNYILFFPSFISGPINRYDHFSESFKTGFQTDFFKDFKYGGERIVHGMFKKIVLAQIVSPYILTNMRKPLNELSLIEILYGVYAYAFYFYFDFSAYTDMAIGCAKLLGVGLPENFNRPFLKRNIQQLWASWHISLTSWLTDYIYWPLVKKLRNFSFLRERSILLSNICIVVTFLVCGIWHGRTLNFVLWGAYHGLGISAFTVYRNWKRSIRSNALRAYFTSNFSSWLGVFFTFNFFAFGLLLFVMNMKDLRILLSRFL